MIVKVAVAGPFLTPLDYVWPDAFSDSDPQPGLRVWVRLRGRKTLGLIMEKAQASEVPHTKLQPVLEVLDQTPLFTEQERQLLLWASHYYHEPIGNVVQTALPKRLREGAPLMPDALIAWRMTPKGHDLLDSLSSRAVLQKAVLSFLKEHPYPVLEGVLSAVIKNWRPAMKALLEKGACERIERPCYAQSTVDVSSNTLPKPTLNAEQQAAVNAVALQEGFGAFLLEGVTGSGKTETYLGVIEQVLAQGKQAMVLVPEIGLTPQTVQRFEAYLNEPVALMHSALSDKERHCAWDSVRSGQVRVLLGTRSAVFTPMKTLGVCILDEEHDLSFKQQDSFRYSARDCLVRRAQMAQIPVILGSATPSLETLQNALSGRYHYLKLTQRAGGAQMPSLRLLDVRGAASLEAQAGISDALKHKMDEHLNQGGQVLLFLNRRGFAPVQICHDCGWQAICPACDANMTFHARKQVLKCHHCGWQEPALSSCPSCGSAHLVYQGQGTEKIQAMVQQWYPELEVLRVDRETTQTRHQIEQALQRARNGHARILVGTQMLAKGHHFPEVTLVGMIDMDQGLFSCDYRAAERTAQLIVQVAGRAGRGHLSGEVVIQTYQPQHPLLSLLVAQGYDAFAQTALQERKLAQLPPYGFQILLRAESLDAHQAWQFLNDVLSGLENAKAAETNTKNLSAFGPVAAPMLRKQGRYRYQLLLQSSQRGALHVWLGALESYLYAHPLSNKVRWSLDVDPQEMN